MEGGEERRRGGGREERWRGGGGEERWRGRGRIRGREPGGLSLFRHGRRPLQVHRTCSLVYLGGEPWGWGVRKNWEATVLASEGTPGGLSRCPEVSWAVLGAW